MRKKHRRTLEAIFSNPTPSNIKWSDIEALLIALGGDPHPGGGSRVRCALNDVRAVFHRPHPRKEADKGTVASVRKFLINAGINPQKF